MPVSPGQINPARRRSAWPVAVSLVTLRDGAHILDMRSRPSLYILLDVNPALWDSYQVSTRDNCDAQGASSLAQRC